MSSQSKDSSTVESEQGVHAAPHPRAAGFRVLSRLARCKTEEDPAYLPRHRSESDTDALPAVG
jgi:hypothetical protein